MYSNLIQPTLNTIKIKIPWFYKVHFPSQFDLEEEQNLFTYYARVRNNCYQTCEIVNEILSNFKTAGFERKSRQRNREILEMTLRDGHYSFSGAPSGVAKFSTRLKSRRKFGNGKSSPPSNLFRIRESPDFTRKRRDAFIASRTLTNSRESARLLLQRLALRPLKLAKARRRFNLRIQILRSAKDPGPVRW